MGGWEVTHCFFYSKNFFFAKKNITLPVFDTKIDFWLWKTLAITYFLFSWSLHY
jgi:hypothetical protein